MDALHMATALAYWYWVVPDVATMKTLGWGWALWLYAVNAAAIFAFYGSIELFTTSSELQGTRFKYNAKFPSEHPSGRLCSRPEHRHFLRSFFITIRSGPSSRSHASGALPTARRSDFMARHPRLSGVAGPDRAGHPRVALLSHSTGPSTPPSSTRIHSVHHNR